MNFLVAGGIRGHDVKGCLLLPASRGGSKEGGGEKREGRGPVRVLIVPLCEDGLKAAC